MTQKSCLFVLCAVALLLVVQGASAEQYTCAPLNPAFVSYADGEDVGEETLVSNETANCMLMMSTAELPYPLTGLVPAPATLVWSDQPVVSADSSSLPSTFDLRDERRLTPVKDQGKAGSCWTFATYASLESTLLTDTGVAWDFSENNMKDLCSNLYPDGFDRGPYDGGQAFMSTAYLARWSGPVNESDDPYDLPMPQNVSPTDLSPVVHVQNVTFLPPRTGPLDNDQMKGEIRDQGAIYVGFFVNWTCFDDVHTCLTYYRPDNGTYKSDGGHGVALVGWDDTYPAANFKVAPPGPGAFIAKNSWGESAGDGGYFYISYYEPEIGNFMEENSTFIGDNTDAASVLFTGESADSLDHVYQYDPLGWTASIGAGTGSTTMYGANVFTADGYEDLRSVGFYTREPGTDYTVAVFHDSDAPPVNASGPVTWVNGTADLPGYHTVHLPEPVSLSPGRTFSVILKVDAPTDTNPLVVEKPIEKYSSNATAGPGQSYISRDGSTWDDLTQIDGFANTNLCIKAFTTDALVVPDDYATIQEAVDAAAPGETVWVESGTYDEDVVVNKAISLRGTDTGDGMPAVHGVSITGDGAAFDGFRVTGNRNSDPALYINAPDVTVQDTVVTGNKVGIMIGQSGNVTLENNTMTNNTYNFAYASDNPAPHNTIDLSNTVDDRPVVYLEGVSGAAIPDDAGAVVCVNCSDITISGLSLDHLYYGVALIGSSGVTAENCAIADSNYGVLIINSSDCTIADTAFETDRRGVYASEGSRDLKILNSSFVSDYYGAAFSDSDAVSISGNSFENCGYGLAMRTGSNCTVENNAIEGCSRAGLALRNYDGATVTMNTVNNSSCGAEISGVLNSSVSKNTFSGSDASVFADDLQGTYIYLNNFIGAFSGSAVSEAAAMSTAVPSAGEVRDSENLAADVFSFTGETSAAPLDTISAASSEGIWHSPVEENYWYRGIGHTNYTGNYWSTYNGTDANGDGIGDTPFVFAGKDLDLYPLMDRFEVYATSAPDSEDSSSDGTVGASGDLKAGATASMHFEGSAVTTINVTAGQRIDGIMLTVAPASSGPAGLDAPVYQYLLVNLTYTTDDALSEADFTFSVPKSWLTAKSLSPGEVALWRYHNGTWKALPTKILSEDGDHVVYRAVSPGFSCFAVASGGEAVTPAPTETAASSGSEVETNPVETVQTETIAPATVATEEPSTTAETLPPTTQQSPLGLAPLLALGALLLLVRRR